MISKNQVTVFPHGGKLIINSYGSRQYIPSRSYRESLQKHRDIPKAGVRITDRIREKNCIKLLSTIFGYSQEDPMWMMDKNPRLVTHLQGPSKGLSIQIQKGSQNNNFKQSKNKGYADGTTSFGFGASTPQEGKRNTSKFRNDYQDKRSG